MKKQYPIACKGCNQPDHGRIPEHPHDGTLEFYTLVFVGIFIVLLLVAVTIWGS